MRLHRFITPFKQIGETITINHEPAVHQMMRVFRMRIGDRVIVCDNSYTDYVCKITDRDDMSVTLHIEAKNNIEPDGRELIIALALIKKESFEYALEKMTEVGVTKIIPIITKRTVKTGFRRERYEDILREATEQSGRGKVPELSDPIELTSLVQISFDGIQMAADFSQQHIDELISPHDTGRMVYIGPEGGWDDTERLLFEKYQISSVSLGNTVLRAETAATIAAWCTKNR